MKRILSFLFVIFILSDFASAQTSKHVLGLRFGSGDGFGTEISYQHGLTSNNRLELDLGFRNDHVNYMNERYHYTRWGLTGLYHWVMDLEGDFNWYVGAGGKLGSWNYDQGYDYKYDDGLFLAAAGDIGVEYSFPVGIQLALNARPEFGLINHGTVINVGLAVRYKFR
jgi:hypothetical protein